MVVLFGSYGNGTAHTDSDIDVRMEPILVEKNKDRSGFLVEIMKTGQVIYKRDQAFA
ncbi:nucleotidyltransferase domain-containing protein [Salicibibacter cibi]|uniref:Nucleotidyltransferase domain-containing protein n=1 Tax=Salicibibacter cibi TaxID=2743001 RepID=A0A7T6ZBE6_9BACI|nr:nucleotidyltransferase domain-containing protein [Salicibibacter cibi]QQK80409.1 nucleotidyltransferase domain-containing protein [Salicibibacter cibi]